MKLELLTNATVVDDAIRFVTALDVIKDELAALLPGFSPDYDLIKKPLEKELH
jgi:hypothetical protein